MTIDDVMLRVADALRDADVPFMLVGGFSSNYYGVPRSTRDVDFVVQLTAPLTAAFAQTLGHDFEADPQLSFETKTGTQRQEFRVAGTVFKVEIFRLSDDAHDQERFRRRRRLDVQGHQVYLPSPEDVVITKLRWARSKDREDVKAVIGVQADNLDWNYIDSWCERHGTRQKLEEIRRTVPKI